MTKQEAKQVDFMSKNEALALFDRGDDHPVKDLADAAGIISQAVSNWPDVMRQYHLEKMYLGSIREGMSDEEYENLLITDLRKRKTPRQVKALLRRWDCAEN